MYFLTTNVLFHGSCVHIFTQAIVKIEVFFNSSGIVPSCTSWVRTLLTIRLACRKTSHSEIPMPSGYVAYITDDHNMTVLVTGGRDLFRTRAKARRSLLFGWRRPKCTCPDTRARGRPRHSDGGLSQYEKRERSSNNNFLVKVGR
jgi:hypothetical protein